MKQFVFAAVLALVLAGCATPKIDWAARMGHYTYDQAVMDYGPPDRSARLTDGSTVVEWMTRSGQVVAIPEPYFGSPYCFEPYPLAYSQTYFPPRFLRLTFGPDGKLKAATSFSK